MVKVKPESAKQPKKGKPRGAKVSAKQPTRSSPRSPTARSNTASNRDGSSILDAQQQKSYKAWIAEIKQIQGLLICQCGLSIQSKSYCAQTAQDELFVINFPLFYDIWCKDPVLGSRVSKIPLLYLTVGTSKAMETITGEKMRKKYSSMKTYINNTLTPIYKRLVICEAKVVYRFLILCCNHRLTRNGIPSGKNEGDVLYEVRKEAHSVRGKSANDDPQEEADDPLNTSLSSATTSNAAVSATSTSSSSSSSAYVFIKVKED